MRCSDLVPRWSNFSSLRFQYSSYSLIWLLVLRIPSLLRPLEVHYRDCLITGLTFDLKITQAIIRCRVLNSWTEWVSWENTLCRVSVGSHALDLGLVRGCVPAQQQAWIQCVANLPYRAPCLGDGARRFIQLSASFGVTGRPSSPVHAYVWPCSSVDVTFGGIVFWRADYHLEMFSLSFLISLIIPGCINVFTLNWSSAWHHHYFYFSLDRRIDAEARIKTISTTGNRNATARK